MHHITGIQTFKNITFCQCRRYKTCKTGQPEQCDHYLAGFERSWGLRRQLVSFKPLEGGKQEQLGDNFLIVIVNNSKCTVILKFKQP